MQSSIEVARDGAVARITLNRPDCLNAFDGPMAIALLAALQSAGADPLVRAVLLTGAGRGFSAGQDLRVVAVGQDLGTTIETRFNPLIRAIRTLPKPVVCAVHGVAAGAGANLALACDIVLAARSSRFLQAFVHIGLIPDAGGTWLLPHLAGQARARGMAMLGEPVPAPQAEAWGMIWRCIDDDDLLPEAFRLAAQLAALPTQAIRLMKRAFQDGRTLDAQLDFERDLQREAGFSPDFAEGVAAFLAKRQPSFTGRPE